MTDNLKHGITAEELAAQEARAQAIQAARLNVCAAAEVWVDEAAGDWLITDPEEGTVAEAEAKLYRAVAELRRLEDR